MCKKNYDDWCYLVEQNLTDYIDYVNYLDPVVGEQNFGLLATTFSWYCDCNTNHIVDIDEFKCYCSSAEVVHNVHMGTETCTVCGVQFNNPTTRSLEANVYYANNGSVIFPTYYSAEKNFDKFITSFSYPYTLYCNVTQCRQIDKYVQKRNITERSMFLFLKGLELPQLYEYIPRFLHGHDVELLSITEADNIKNRFKEFTVFYSTYRVKQKRKSLPHRGFLFVKFCEQEDINRFRGVVRLPQLKATIHVLEAIWQEYELYLIQQLLF